MTEEAAFLKAIAGQPDDDHVRLWPTPTGLRSMSVRRKMRCAIAAGSSGSYCYEWDAPFRGLGVEPFLEFGLRLELSHLDAADGRPRLAH